MNSGNVTSRRHHLRLIVIGGGYAGLSALITVRRRLPDAEITLIDPREHHVKITRLHETVRRPLKEVRIPFRDLAERFGFRHIRAAPAVNEDALRLWYTDRTVAVDTEQVPFDYVVIATGSAANTSEKDDTVFDLEDVFEQETSQLLERSLTQPGTPPTPIALVGGGATGIQFLFEIAHVLETRHLGHRLLLIDSEDGILKQFPPEFGRYVTARMAEHGIEYLPGRFYRGRRGERLLLEDVQTGEHHEVESRLTFLFLGKTPAEVLMANVFGQVTLKKDVLDCIYTAGDCAYFNSVGSNVLTAQCAVRKGMTVARNILRRHGDVFLPLPYVYQDLGYLISLGPSDAIGWIGLKRNIVAGFPAFVLKELVEAQYDLLLSGIDTYVV